MLHKPLPSALVSGRAIIPPGPASWDLAELGSGAYETNPQYEVSRDQKKIVTQINILKGVFEQKRTVCGLFSVGKGGNRIVSRLFSLEA